MPKKILLADDSITIQKVVELTFSDGDYEVVAVNNGARAIQKLSEMRPDIILSDIIMPEKNGYEVCEYVKSHPDLRTIPVVLLTGTFEPFDPDRADKAGCDAVVTKPFESQSLIQRVEELIQQSRATAAGVPADTPWIDDAPAEPAPESQPTGAVDHDADIFAAAAPSEASTDMPFETPAASPFGGVDAFEPASEPAAAEAAPWDDQQGFGGETRGVPTASFEELERQAEPEAEPEAEPQVPAADAASPWDEQPAFGGETAFPPLGDDLQQSASAPDTPSTESSPWDEQPAYSADSGNPPAFNMANDAPAQETPWDEPAAAAAEPASAAGSPWDEPASGGETRAFPKMSFDDLQRAAEPDVEAPEQQSTSPESLWNEPAAPVEEPAAPPTAETSPWDEPPAYGGETRAFPKLSAEELQQMAAAPAAEAEPSNPPAETAWAAPDTAVSEPAGSIWDEPAAVEEPAAESAWSEPAAEPAASTGSMWDEPAAGAPPQAASMWDEPTAEAAPPVETAWSEPASEAGAASEPAWSMTSEAPESPAETGESFSTSASAPFADSEVLDQTPFGAAADAPASESRDEEAAWSPTPAAAEPENDEEPSYVAPEAAAATDAFVPIAAAAQPQGGGFSGELSDEQLDRIARRVIELLSDKVIRDIAWEVIPDTAQMVVKERIRQLESEA